MIVPKQDWSAKITEIGDKKKKKKCADIWQNYLEVKAGMISRCLSESRWKFPGIVLKKLPAIHDAIIEACWGNFKEDMR